MADISKALKVLNAYKMKHPVRISEVWGVCKTMYGFCEFFEKESQRTHDSCDNCKVYNLCCKTVGFNTTPQLSEEEAAVLKNTNPEWFI